MTIADEITTHTAEARRIRALLLDQPWPGMDPRAQAAWDDVATAMAGLFEALARAGEGPTFLAGVEEAITAAQAEQPAKKSPRPGAFAALNQPGLLTLNLQRYSAPSLDTCLRLSSRAGHGTFLSLSNDWHGGGLITAQFEALPFHDASIDRIYFHHGLESSLEPGAVLAECMRVLRPGGMLLLLTPQRQSLKPRRPDFMRLTTQGYRRIFASLDAQDVRVTADDNGWAQVRQLVREMEPAAGLAEAARTQALVLRQLVLRLLEGLAGSDQQFAHLILPGSAVTVCASKRGQHVPRSDLPPFDPQAGSGALLAQVAGLLRCPVSGAPLDAAAGGFRTPDASRTYPIIEGRLRFDTVAAGGE